MINTKLKNKILLGCLLTGAAVLSVTTFQYWNLVRSVEAYSDEVSMQLSHPDNGGVEGEGPSALDPINEIARGKLQRNLEQPLFKLLSKKIDLKVMFWPGTLDVDGESYSIKYTFDLGLQNYIKSLMSEYKTDYTSIVILDNQTGKVLAALDYSGASEVFGQGLSFLPNHPGASLFKIVSSAALIESGSVDPHSEFYFNGRSTTLFKSQLFKTNFNRWGRQVDFDEAFARSNNVVFGKAAITHLSDDQLESMALQFGFNGPILSDLSLPQSVYEASHGEYERAEKASGFNKATVISPLHAAQLSSVIANHGIYKYPYVVESIYDQDQHEVYYAQEISRRAIAETVVDDIDQMMQSVITKGTARKSFRTLDSSIRRDIEDGKIIIGGKTGSITGGEPQGKRDWFTSFMRTEHHPGISVAVMGVNQKKWYVRSAYLAKKVFEYYYDREQKNQPKVP